MFMQTLKSMLNTIIYLLFSYLVFIKLIKSTFSQRGWVSKKKKILLPTQQNVSNLNPIRGLKTHCWLSFSAITE